MGSPLELVFQAVRDSCESRPWSQGVKLARGEAVALHKSTADEIALQVRDDSRGIAALVSLYPDEEDWACDCGLDDDPCHHVAAGAIAAKQAGGAENLPRTGRDTARLVYHFTREQHGLTLTRKIRAQEKETPLAGPLKKAGSGVSATETDWEVESALAGVRGDAPPAAALRKILRGLARGESDVFLDGAAVQVASEPVGIHVVVKSEGPGVWVQGEQDPRIQELFSNGAALCQGDKLQPWALPSLTPKEETLVRDGALFGPDRWAELSSEILPPLSRKMKVDVRTERLQPGERLQPRLSLDLQTVGEQLQVTPAIVYGSPVQARVEGGQLIPVGDRVPERDRDAERRLRDELWRRFNLEADTQILLNSREAVAFRDKVARWEGRVTGSGLDDFAKQPPLEPQVSFAGGRLQVSFVSGQEGADELGSTEGEAGGGSSEPRQADPARVFQAWQDGDSLVPLTGGGFAPIPTDWLRRYGSRVLDLLESQKETDELPKAQAPTLAALADDLDLNVPEPTRAIAEKLASFKENAGREPQLPSDLQAKLRDYQLHGAAWLQELKEDGLGAMLADDMGLGKTLQALSVVSRNALVVAPASVASNWIAEIKKFRPGLAACPYYGPSRELDPDADVVVTTYALLRLEADTFAGRHWDMVVLDEAQTIKNPASQVSQAAFRLRADFRLTLTGTPVENRLLDLWSQMHFLNPGLLGGRSVFSDRYVRPIRAGDDATGRLLRERVKPFFLRRLKRDVAPELPARTERVLHVELSEDERAAYETVRAAARKDVVSRLQGGGSVLEALEALLRLRQACCAADLIPGSKTENSAKLDLLTETLSEICEEGHKALVFSQWTSLLDRAEPRLDEAGVSYTRLDGSTRDREGVVSHFQDQNGPPVLLMSLKAGGVGLNLTAADHVFLLDPWWNPATEDQAIDRAHRIGQDRPVMVHKLVAQNTVEEKILALQDEKRALSDAVTGETSESSLSRDDLFRLLEE